MPLRCEIISQERKLYDDEVDIVIVQGTEGEMGILPQHAPLVTSLSYGELRVRQGESEEAFAIGGGVLRVGNDHVIVLADSAEQADEIDMARAEAARERAEQSMIEGPTADPAQAAALEAALRRADLRLKVARRRRQNRGLPPAHYNTE